MTLADNGGDTQTHALQASSPALGQIPYQTNGCGTTITTDQRGESRLASLPCDIGAYELTSAATCFVEYTGDSTTDFSSEGSIALQWAVDAVSSGGTIKVAGTCAGVQTRNSLTQTVYISQNVTIQGGYTTTDWSTSDPDTNPTTLDAAGGGRVAYIPSGYTVTLTSLTLTGGDSSQGGGDDYGGGLYQNGSSSWMTVISSTIRGNQAIGASSLGGGIVNAYGQLDMTNSSVTNNEANLRGGGLYNQSSPAVATLVNSTFSNNRANKGGGIHNQSSSQREGNQQYVQRQSGQQQRGCFEQHRE